jgi:hypothetical protein
VGGAFEALAQDVGAGRAANRAAKAERERDARAAKWSTDQSRAGSRWMAESTGPMAGSMAAVSQPGRACTPEAAQTRSVRMNKRSSRRTTMTGSRAWAR